MKTRDLIALLQKMDPEAEVGIATSSTHYVSMVDGVRAESSPSSVPAGASVVVIEASDESFTPAEEDEG